MTLRVSFKVVWEASANMFVKICGITDPNIAKITIKHGADFIGIVLTATSKRFIELKKAIPIIKAIQEKNSTPVLVFRNESFEIISSIVKQVGNCMVQFQARKHPDTQKLIHHFNTIVSFSAESFYHENPIDQKQYIEQFKNKKTILMIDNAQPGSGKTFNWDTFNPPDFPWFLAGGLNTSNIHHAIKKLAPMGVDVATGVEDNDGKKDLRLIEAFIQAAKRKP